MTIRVVRRKGLPWSTIAHEFVGDDHGGVPITFLLVDAEPGGGPSLHTHPSHEVIIVSRVRRRSMTARAGAQSLPATSSSSPSASCTASSTRARALAPDRHPCEPALRDGMGNLIAYY
jgi:hypothetical protein